MNSPTVEAFTDDAERLAFEVPNQPGRSYERAESHGVVVRPLGAYHFEVSIADIPLDDRESHVVECYLDDLDSETVPFGRCSCKGWEFHDGECAHLWGLWFAKNHGVVDIQRAADGLDAAPTCPVCGATHPPEAKP